MNELGHVFIKFLFIEWYHSIFVGLKGENNLHVTRDGNGAGRGRVSLSHTHPRRKIHSHPHPQTQRVSNFFPIPIPTG